MLRKFSRRSSLLSRKEVISTVLLSLLAGSALCYLGVDLRYVIAALLTFVLFA
jgi:hypothetical protein